MNIRDSSLLNETDVIQIDDQGYISQYFCLYHSDDGYYQIVNLNSGLYINVFGASGDDGARIIQYQFEDADNEKWVMEANGDGSWRITPKMARQLGLGPADNSDESGTNIVQKNFDGNDHSKWFFSIAGDPRGATRLGGADAWQ